MTSSTSVEDQWNVKKRTTERTKATETRSECVILIAWPLQQCLHERTTMLRHSYFAFLVYACSTESLVV